MAFRVLVRDRPNRAIALATPSQALVFRHSPSTSTQQGASSSTTSLPSQLSNVSPSQKCVVELVSTGKADLNEYKTTGANVHGTLGLITVDNDVFLCVVSGALKVATVRPGESILKILAVDFHCLNQSDYDYIHDANSRIPDMTDEDGFEIEDKRDLSFEHPCSRLGKLLSAGSFYYSTDFDLTSRFQERAEAVGFDFDSLDKGYSWNSYMIQPLIDFRNRLSSYERGILDSTRLLTSAIRGFALTVNVPAPSSPARASKTGFPSTLTVISRLSCLRAGTRFNARGIDDEGHVANFVETETIFWTPAGIAFSYAQLRGSIPVFWEQAPGLIPGQQKIQITRSAQATQPAFDKHFEELEVKYGPIHVVNLLSKERSGEVELSQRYHNHIAHSSLNNRQDDNATSEHRFIRETAYDFHSETRTAGYDAAGGITSIIHDDAERFSYCLIEESQEKQPTDDVGEAFSPRAIPILQQSGIFRVNCLDCLDRTNLVQTIISQLALEIWLEHRAERLTPDFRARHGSLWADNGDALSRIYAGTGALKSSFTRHGKMSFAGALADARKTATRMYINNFADKGRQNTMDMLLGRLLGQTPVYLFDPINDYVIGELNRRAHEYSSMSEISIWAGTYNLKGSMEGINKDISPWLCPPVDGSQKHPELVAVGFQEIVELSPQHIMSTEPTRRQAWEKAVKRTLNESAKAANADPYVLLRGGQLVGASLSIFVQKSILNHIKNVEGSLKKTGMSGVAGNKGAVAIRLEFDNTSLCFVTAHLAAGFANYDERNHDYKTISEGLRFQRNRAIDDHDTVVWLGDFNYRIGLSNEKARHFAKTGDLEQLYLNDQLNIQMVKGLAFPYYSEARITFLPTYKYDVGTDTYDTSEKARIPAWTDRILRKGNNIRQLTYTTAPLRFSDHRPVYATFHCTINVVDQALKDRMNREIYAARKTAVQDMMAEGRRSTSGTVSTSRGGVEDDDDDDLIGYESIEPSLPPASSNRRKWWIDGGMPAQSTIQPPGADYVPNPVHPSNPFAPSNQPAWVPTRLPLRNASAQSNTTSTPATHSAAAVPTHERPHPRLRSVTETSSRSDGSTGSSARRPAPQVPRKPAKLSSPPVSPPVAESEAETNWASQQEGTPMLPPRTGILERAPSKSTGLMDEVDEDSGKGLSAWQPLKPG